MAEVTHRLTRCAAPDSPRVLDFQRDSARHRVLFVAALQGGRYEVELFGQRWYIRSVFSGARRVVGSPSGYDSFDSATAMANDAAETGPKPG